MLVAGKESSKWLSEYSNLHFHEMHETLIHQVTKIASRLFSN